jgi:hypothetical protein
LMKILHPEACVRNDLLLGFPADQDQLLANLATHVAAPNTEWGTPLNT